MIKKNTKIYLSKTNKIFGTNKMIHRNINNLEKKN